MEQNKYNNIEYDRIIIDFDKDGTYENIIREVSKQVEQGNTSGVYPSWELVKI